MTKNQLNRGQRRRLMYVENKDRDIDGVAARIVYVTFSKSGRTIYYRGRELNATGPRGIRGNFADWEAGEEYWISGPKKNGQDTHWAEAHRGVEVDPDALEESRAWIGKEDAPTTASPSSRKRFKLAQG